jgi:carbonic anhydrase/acetyltransferase-like protein (isoleucine patch superfamily)
MPVIPYKEFIPDVKRALFIAPDCWITGKVVLHENTSVFFGACLRGDVQRIIVGAGSNIQERAILHTSHGLGDCVVGQGVTVGHAAILHGCIIKDNCIIGMGSTILDEAVIGEDCIVGANSLVTMRSQIPPGSLVLGSPAKAVRKLTPLERKSIRDAVASYIDSAGNYAAYFAGLNS